MPEAKAVEAGPYGGPPDRITPRLMLVMAVTSLTTFLALAGTYELLFQA